MVNSIEKAMGLYRVHVVRFIQFELELASKFGKTGKHGLPGADATRLNEWNLRLQGMEQVLAISEAEAAEIRHDLELMIFKDELSKFLKFEKEFEEQFDRNLDQAAKGFPEAAQKLDEWRTNIHNLRKALNISESSARSVRIELG